MIADFTTADASLLFLLLALGAFGLAIWLVWRGAIAAGIAAAVVGVLIFLVG